MLLLRTILLCLLLNGCATRSINVVTDAAPAATNSVDQLNLAETYYRDGKYPLARTQFEELLKIHAKNEYLWFKLGNTLVKMELYDNAAFAFENAIALNPRYGRAAYNLGLIRLLQSQLAFDRAHQVSPENSPIVSQVDQMRKVSRQLIGLINSAEAPATRDGPLDQGVADLHLSAVPITASPINPSLSESRH